MGATMMKIVVVGKDARHAFSKATGNARQMYVSEGYTGTIAEKTDFVEFSLPSGLSANEFCNRVIEGDTSTSTLAKASGVCEDKWGSSCMC